MVARPLTPALARTASSQLPSAASEIAAFQLAASDAEIALDALKGARKLWGQFVPQVRAIVQASAGQPWPIDHPQLRPRVLAADFDRLAIKNQIGNLSAVGADPLASLLRMTFLQPLDGLYTILGKRSGSTWLPVIDPDRFEWVIAESDGILNDGERRLEADRDRALRQAKLLQRQIDDERAHELERLEREHWSFKGLWKRLTRTTLGKVVTWVVVTLLGGILTVYGVPALAQIIGAIWSAIRSQVGM